MAKTWTASELIQELSNTKSEKRASAATKLRKQHFTEASSAVFDALKREVKDRRTWKCQFELILTVGEFRISEALPFLWEYSRSEDTRTAMVPYALGDAIVRICNRGQRDTEAVFEVIRTQDQRMIRGALHAMADLRLVPTDGEIEEILRVAEDPRSETTGQHYPGDPSRNRLWVAVAAAGWLHVDGVTAFLQKCLQIKAELLQEAAKISLSGKYPKMECW